MHQLPVEEDARAATDVHAGTLREVSVTGLSHSLAQRVFSDEQRHVVEAVIHRFTTTSASAAFLADDMLAGRPLRRCANSRGQHVTPQLQRTYS